jgi:hypothetical protein
VYLNVTSLIKPEEGQAYGKNYSALDFKVYLPVYHIKKKPRIEMGFRSVYIKPLVDKESSHSKTLPNCYS